MNQTSTVTAPKRKKTPDLGTDRSDAYNKIHNTQIRNNHMLDRFLRNREELQKLGIRVK